MLISYLHILIIDLASRLLQYSSHPMDNYARLAVSEAAAHTASYIFYQSRDGEYRSRSQYRQSFDAPYAFDDELFSRSRTRSHSAHGHRSRSRHGSFSRSRNGSFSQSRGIPLPGHAYSSSSFSGQPGSYGSYSSHGVSTPYPHGVALPPGSSYGSMPMISPPYSAPLDVASSYQGSSLGDYPRSRSNSFSYPQGYSQQVYPQQGYYGYSQQEPAYSSYVPSYIGSAMSSAPPVAAPTTIIIHKSRKSKHRRSR